MIIKIKKLHPDAKWPTKAYSLDAGFDLYSLQDVSICSSTTIKIRTGIALEIPEGWCGIIKDRSSLGSKGINCHAGVIDSSFRNEILVCLHNNNPTDYSIGIPLGSYYNIESGERIAQILFHQVPEVEIIEVDELSETERGNGGFGSTGK